MKFSKDGVMLANVANSGGVSVRKTGSEGGNDTHDSRSGKFAPKGPPAENRTNTPNADPIEVKRMMDAVRDAAREYDLPEEGDIKEFLQGRAKNPAQVDVAGFLRLVQEQIKDDLVDIFDHQLRLAGSNPRGRRTVRLKAPQGYANRTLRGLPDEVVAEIIVRLEARGHESAKLDSFFEGKVKEDEPDGIKTKRAAIAASDEWLPTEGGWAFDDEDDDPVQHDPIQLAEAIAKNMPAPIVNVTVEPPKPMHREVLRDEKGLAIGVREVPAE